MNTESGRFGRASLILACASVPLVLLAGAHPAVALPQIDTNTAAAILAAQLMMTSPRPFTDDPLIAGSTTVTALHFTELRARIDALRATWSLGPFAYTNSMAPGTVIRAIDVTEMRTALSAAYTAASIPPPTYSTSPAAGMTITSADIQDLRDAVTALE